MPRVTIGNIIANSGYITAFNANFENKNNIPQINIDINAKYVESSIVLLYLDIKGILEKNIKQSRGAKRGKKICDKIIVLNLLVSKF